MKSFFRCHCQKICHFMIHNVKFGIISNLTTNVKLLIRVSIVVFFITSIFFKKGNYILQSALSSYEMFITFEVSYKPLLFISIIIISIFIILISKIPLPVYYQVFIYSRRWVSVWSIVDIIAKKKRFCKIILMHSLA